jgi:2-oxoglutarate ferredoxin oxidoreductase subunit beta
MPEAADFLTPNKPTWCPGCGNHGLWRALRDAYAELDLSFEELAVVWGIGCHGNGADFTRAQGFHALHGRALPPASAIKLTNPELTVVVEMGDGDCYGIGGNHFIHTVRRNIDLTAIVHDNQIYGLTTGQASPTSDHLMKTMSTPHGVLEEPVNALGIALAQGVTFAARGFAGDIPHLTELFKAAISHRGFALVDVFQPCVSFNKIDTFAWFRERAYRLDESGHDPSDRMAAIELSMSVFHDLRCEPDTCRVPIGIYYQETGTPTYGDGLPWVDGPQWREATAPRDVAALMKRFG